MKKSPHLALKPPRRGKSIGFVEMIGTASSPGTGAHWTSYNSDINITSTSLHAAGAASAGLGTAT